MDATSSAVALLYRRAGFGATPAQIAAGAARGYPATVDALIAGLGEAPDATGEALGSPKFSARAAVVKGDADAARSARKAQRAVYRKEIPATQDWWMNRMIVTDTPLREKLTLLWSGHFATGITKVRDPQLMYNQNQLLRSQGAGPFTALTQAVAEDPAMMVWLDTDTDNAKHPNENFARECMELFTLGIGNYSQADVTAAANAFTGYSLEPATRTFVFRPRQHADGVQTYLGHTGELSGTQAVDDMVHDAASAPFIVASTWSHFAYPVATNDPVVTSLVSSYSPDQPFATLLRAVFLHPLFTSATTRGGLVKQPLEYVAGAARALRLDANLRRLDTTTGLPVAPAPAASSAGATAGGARHETRLVSLATALGQIMYDPPSVGGWPPNGYWLNTATSLARLQAARILANAADLSALDAMSASDRVAGTAALLGIDDWGSTTTAALSHAAGQPAELMTLALTAPEYVLA